MDCNLKLNTEQRDSRQRDIKDAARAERGQTRRFVMTLATGLAMALFLWVVFGGPGSDLWWLFIVCPLTIYMLQVLVRPMSRRR